MDLNGIDSISLTSELCRRLYPNGVTNLDFSAPKTKPDIIYRGKNNQNVLVAIDVYPALKKDEQEFLEKLLMACELTMDDIALVNIRDWEMPMSGIINQLTIKKCIFFGILSLSIDFPIGDKAETVIIYDDKYFIRTSPLSVLQKDPAKKKTLWHALKNMFKV